MFRSGKRTTRALAALALVLGCAAGGCKTVHEEVQPLRETTLTVARSGGDVTLSWIGVRGTYYSVMYTDARGAKAQWKLLPDAVNVREGGEGRFFVRLASAPTGNVAVAVARSGGDASVVYD